MPIQHPLRVIPLNNHCRRLLSVARARARRDGCISWIYHTGFSRWGFREPSSTNSLLSPHANDKLLRQGGRWIWKVVLPVCPAWIRCYRIAPHGRATYHILRIGGFPSVSILCVCAYFTLESSRMIDRLGPSRDTGDRPGRLAQKKPPCLDKLFSGRVPCTSNFVSRFVEPSVIIRLDGSVLWRTGRQYTSRTRLLRPTQVGCVGDERMHT